MIWVFICTEQTNRSFKQTNKSLDWKRHWTGRVNEQWDLREGLSLQLSINCCHCSLWKISDFLIWSRTLFYVLSRTSLIWLFHDALYRQSPSSTVLRYLFIANNRSVFFYPAHIFSCCFSSLSACRPSAGTHCKHTQLPPGLYLFLLPLLPWSLGWHLCGVLSFCMSVVCCES